MKRAELVQKMVLVAISDDYEDIVQITGSIDRLQMNASKDEISRALRELIDLGHAKAWRLSGFEPFAQELKGMPPIEDIKPWGAYFFITPAGKDAREADRTW